MAELVRLVVEYRKGEAEAMPCVYAVHACFNTKVKTAGTGIRYFGFPKNAHNRDVWVNLCRRADSSNPKNAVICSVHFTKDDYIDDLKSCLHGIENPKNKRLLREDAVPSLHLHNSK